MDNKEQEVVTEVQSSTENASITLITVKSHIFVLFAEYLGFVSPLVEWAEECGVDKNFPEYKKKFLEIEASRLFKLVKQDYTNEQLKEYYEIFYDIALCKYDTL